MMHVIVENVSVFKISRDTIFKRHLQVAGIRFFGFCFA